MGPCSDGWSKSIFAASLCILCHLAASCRVQICSEQYARSQEDEGIAQGSTYRYCTILRSYANCVRATERSCHGDLTYHSMKSLIIQWNRQNNCSSIINKGPQPDSPGYNSNKQGNKYQRVRPSASAECTSYRPVGGAPIVYSHCGLFGDPHVRTFYNELMTCGTMGAWPLIDNPHMAVQVTNSPVGKGSNATASTKITVIVRQHGPCATEKTYEAQADSLPGVFLDGSRSSGHGVRIKEEKPGRHIEIHFRYIATRIILRQVGPYLTFAIRIPQEIAVLGDQGESLVLCLNGCPRRERINFNQLGHPDDILSVITSRGHETVSKKEALTTCRNYNVTGFYFDACVFDLLTTGDSSFGLAARDAMLDAISMSPVVASHNKTSDSAIVPRGVMTSENSATGRSCSVVVLALMLWVLLMMSHR